jgi:pyrimidine-nucleoside phosphorylase
MRLRSIVELIAAKRDGQALAPEEITWMIQALTKGEIADYQFSAFLMAVFFRGMTDEETVALTYAMLHSGSVVDLSHVQAIKVDKHSTGGVGDKTSISLAPLLAACGVPVPMVSGRGLGHTGGTLDKLEAIPGFRTDLGVEHFKKQVQTIGTCMIGQTADIAPADKKIYALRDVTATVECIPLIVASILSKKLAEGIDALVLDVKVGAGAFMKDEARALALANALVSVGTRAGKRMSAILTRMDSPLGREIGNANETREAIEILRGGGPDDLRECTMVLAEEMLLLGKAAKTPEEARTLLQANIQSGKALRVLEQMVEAQGGDPKVVEHPEHLPQPEVRVPVLATASGFVAGIEAFTLGMTAVSMGAGRSRADQAVDPSVGITLDKKPGDAVKTGDQIATLLLRKHHDAVALGKRVSDAFSYTEQKPTLPPIVVARIGS